jgi:hypothetical protein
MIQQCMRARPLATALTMVLFLAGCASKPATAPGPVIEPDVGRIIKLPDGSTCTEPFNLAQDRDLPGALQVKELFDSAAAPEEVLKQAQQVKVTDAEVEAAWFDVCRAYFKGELQKPVFDKNRGIYLELRQSLLAQGIKAWVDKKDGIKDPGKLCMVVFDNLENLKNFVRKVPETTTVDDCALFAIRAQATEVLLGCTEGSWKNHWAKGRIPGGPLGARKRGLEVRDTPLAPDPNCGWT